MDVEVGLLTLELGVDSLSRLLLSYLLHRFGNHAQSTRFAIDLEWVRIACRIDFFAELDSHGFILVLLAGRQYDAFPLYVSFPSSVRTSVRPNPSTDGMVDPSCLSDRTKSPIVTCR